MKAILGVVALFGWFARCQDVPFPDHFGDHHSRPRAGQGATSDAGRSGSGAAGSAAREDAGEPDAARSDAGDSPSDAGPDDAEVDPQRDDAQARLPCDGPPGLYAGANCGELDPAVRAYEPQYELWSDGSEKQRFIALPVGAQIDASNPNRWAFPVGTRLYKTFSLRGQRIETRVMEKVVAAASVDSWRFRVYLWAATQDSVELVVDSGPVSIQGVPADPNDLPKPEGLTNVRATGHDIPSVANCKSCHNQPGLDAVNGFGALQLNHPGAGYSLGELIRAQTLKNPSGELGFDEQTARLPGDPRAREALGYLHANCGHCHGINRAPGMGLRLWADVQQTENTRQPAYATAVCDCLMSWKGHQNDQRKPYQRRIVAGHADLSGMVARMGSRQVGDAMPPLGSREVDQNGIDTVSAWIEALDSSLCDVEPACAQEVDPAAR